jgi:hypothetical protein
LPLYRYWWYLTPELEALNREFELTFSASARALLLAGNGRRNWRQYGVKLSLHQLILGRIVMQKELKMRRSGVLAVILVMFLFHGVGGEHDLNVSLEAHRQLLRFLKENEKDIWIAPLRNISKYIKQQTGK